MNQPATQFRHVARSSLTTEIGFLERSYDSSQQAKAYDLGAVILLPMNESNATSLKQRTAAATAAAHDCCDELVVYRRHRYERYAA